jgi:hypothetical protein
MADVLLCVLLHFPRVRLFWNHVRFLVGILVRVARVRAIEAAPIVLLVVLLGVVLISAANLRYPMHQLILLVELALSHLLRALDTLLKPIKPC